MSCIIDEWQRGCNELITRGLDFRTIDVTDAQYDSDRLTEVSRSLSTVGFEKPESVSSVLMPRTMLDFARPVEDRIVRCVNTFGRARRKHTSFSGWSDTYFERLVGRKGLASGNTKQIGHDQLTESLEKAVTWQTNVKAGIYMQTKFAQDRLRTRGAPCLQYVQISLRENSELAIFALYRSHDYANKALGNLLGLTRMGQLFAHETGRNFSRIVVTSYNPHLPSGTKNKLKAVIDGLL